jgi:hypothetical protein
MKPHAYRITFAEPNLHIYTLAGTGAYAGAEYFDLGNVLTHIRLFYEAQHKSVQLTFTGLKPSGPGPLGGDYVGTLVIGSV